MHNLPTQKDIEPKLLLALHQLGGSARRPDVHQKTAEIMGVTEEDLEIRYPAPPHFGIFYVCTDFSRNRLKERGLLEDNSPRGIWELSELGKQVVKKLLNNEDTSQFFKSAKNEPALDTEDVSIEQEELSDEDELEIIRAIEPDQFERLCAKIFEAMNFENVKYTKISNDKGIDGSGDLVFGLVKFRVVFQAKRYKKDNIVGDPDMRNFIGSMKIDKAEKGVFITTSKFSSSAKSSANEARIELIDGEKLLEILREKRIGYTERLEFDINQNFFEKL